MVGLLPDDLDTCTLRLTGSHGPLEGEVFAWPRQNHMQGHVGPWQKAIGAFYSSEKDLIAAQTSDAAKHICPGILYDGNRGR